MKNLTHFEVPNLYTIPMIAKPLLLPPYYFFQIRGHSFHKSPQLLWLHSMSYLLKHHWDIENQLTCFSLIILLGISGLKEIRIEKKSTSSSCQKQSCLISRQFQFHSHAPDFKQEYDRRILSETLVLAIRRTLVKTLKNFSS
jgi:hypothetical protein